MKEQTKGMICIEHRVAFHRDGMTFVDVCCARCHCQDHAFFQAGSSLDLLSLGFTLQRLLSRIDSYTRSHSDGTRKPTYSHLVAIMVKQRTTNIVGILRLSSLQ